MTARDPAAHLSDLRRMRDGFPQRDVTVDGRPWRVRDTGGRGGSLLLLPGSLGTADIFFRQLLALGDRFRCVAVDYPDANSADLADGLARLMDHLSIGRPDILGASLGGSWLQTFGARHPDRVGTVILANTFADPDELASHPLFLAPVLRAATGAAIKAQWLERLEARPADELRDVQIDLLRAGQDGDLLKARLLAAGTAPPSPVLPQPAARIAIIDCADDPLLPARTRQAVVARYPGARHLALQTGGHYPHVTQAERYNAFLIATLGGEAPR